MIVPKEEMIQCKDWFSLVDYHYTGQDDLPSGIVGCDILKIPEFFAAIDGQDEEYVVVSARNDYGLYYQSQHPDWRDLHKSMRLAEAPQYGYRPLTIEPRVELEHCDPDDRYSIKCYCHTAKTFDKIPKNVKKWYLTNCGVSETNVVPIPFGIAGGGDDGTEKRDIISSSDIDLPRNKLLYVNFQFYTGERADLYGFYSTYSGYTCERNVTFEYYAKALAEHVFVLCPNGNGIDCYRTLEAIYSGCIPVLEINEVTRNYGVWNLPVIFSGSLMNLSVSDLTDMISEVQSKRYNDEAIRLSYWAERIRNGV